MSSILGALFAVLIGMMAIAPVVSYQRQGVENQRIATTAGQFTAISNAANGYLQANYASLEAASTASTPATITVPMLQATGFLSPAISATNPYGQTWSVQVLQPTAGSLQALVLSSGGSAISERVAPAIAAQAGAAGGGFIPYAGQYGSLSSASAQGAFGHWSLSMAGYTNPGAGHLAGLVAFNNSNQQQDYLYRAAVPGAPQLNTMSTALNMGGNDVTNAGTVTAAKAVLPAGNSLQIGSQLVYGDGTNFAIRTPGTVFLQGANGSGTAPLNVGAVSANGNITTTANVVAQGAYLEGNGTYNTAGANSPNGQTSAQSEASNSWAGTTAQDNSGHYAQIWASPGSAGIGTTGNITGQNVYAQGAYLTGNGTFNAAGANSPDGRSYANAYVSNSSASLTAASPSGQNSNMWAGTGGAGISTTGTVGAGNVITPGAVAALNTGCSPAGAMAQVNDGSGTLADCVNGVWRAMGALFQNVYGTQTFGSGSSFAIGPPISKPMFISSLCLYSGAPVGALETALIQVVNSNGIVAQTIGSGGVASNNFYNEPSVSAMVPPGDWAQISITNTNCGFEISY